MGSFWRFAEPVMSLVIARLGEAHGHQIAREAEGAAVTHDGLDSGIICRTLIV